MNSSRAPKQWSLSKHESITSFEAWRQNLQYCLSLDQNFAPFLSDDTTWLKKSPTHPLRGFEDDDEDIPAARRRTAHQKNAHLELMLGQIANFCPIISRNSIVKSSTSIQSIWQAIRAHFGFQSSGSHFLDFANIRLEADERPEDLYQRLMSFVEDNLLIANGNITHHGENIPLDEEMTPTLENMIVLFWLKLIHPELPVLVKQRYGTELRSRTLASLKPEISQALDSLLEEIRTAADSKILRSTASRFRQSVPRPPNRSSYQAPQSKRSRSCPLCKQASRNDQHFLSTCPFLPPDDRLYLSRSRLTTCFDEEEINTPLPYDDLPVPDESEPSHTRIVSHRVSIKRSPQFQVFYKHHALTLTLDTGAETSMIKSSIARSISAPILPSSQQAFQADGVTPLAVVGETHLTLSRDDKKLSLDALVVDDLDVDVLAGTPFMILNDVSVRPAKCQVQIQDSLVICYHPGRPSSSQSHAVRRTQSFVLRSSSPSTTIWPGDFFEADVPPDLQQDSVVALEPHTNSPLLSWPQPQITPVVGGKVRIVNTSDLPQQVRRHDHLCLARPTTDPPKPTTLPPQVQLPALPKAPPPFSDKVILDPDNLMPAHNLHVFRQILRQHDDVFSPTIVGYNGAAGPVEATVNIGPTQPPQRKGRVPQYSRDKLVELQAMFDDLESAHVFQRPEDLGLTVEYLNPSFLVKKPAGGFRLVTAFADVARFCKPQPSLMPDVDSTLRTIARWKYLIKTDLTQAFYQIPLSKSSLKYCGVATPFRGVRVYTRSAMGMPGSETALEEVMCRVLGDLLQEGWVTKLADDLYCGGDTLDDLASTWSRVLQALQRCALRLAPHKTVICPKSTTILGWIWSSGKLSASPHRISALSSCSPPDTVKALRSFLGAYKVLSRVLPNCSDAIDPLESSIAGLQSQVKLQWDDTSLQQFHAAQLALQNHKSITIPRPSDSLWIVTDGSVTKRGIGATLYVSRDRVIHLSGFFSAKLRKHQVNWLPCEVEALCIAAAIKHFSPFIIQSSQPTCVLTDSRPCVQAFDKLCRGEFSASPRVTSFLSTASRYQVQLQHLAGSANLPSDFSSRNAPDCTEPTCQVCSFVHESEDSVVRGVSIHDLLNRPANLPFTTRSAWLSIQNDDPDLRRVYAHLKQGTRPSKKLTNVKDIKRLLNTACISRDGLLVVKRQHPFIPSSEAIVVPRSVLDGLLTALHIKLSHPTRHQLQQVVQRHFFALDMTEAVTRVSAACHTCASLAKVPRSLVSQSSESPPEVIGISFATDVIKRCKQLILVVRESSTSYTTSCLIHNEKHDTLRDALIRLLVGLHPLDGPHAVLRADPAPGFAALSNDDSLQQINVSIEIGRIKNKNKNPVAERAVQEMEEELLRQDPGGGPVTDTSLAVATARLNSRLRHLGLSSRELWTQRSQFSNCQLPISDHEVILSKHDRRVLNHTHSQKSKNPSCVTPEVPPLRVGDLVYLHSDRDKSRARDRYLVVHIDGPWCHIKKFSGPQLRATSYKVKLSECYAVPSSLTVPVTRPPSPSRENDDESSVTPPGSTCPAPLVLTHPFGDHISSAEGASALPSPVVTDPSTGSPSSSSPLADVPAYPPATVVSSPSPPSTSPVSRPRRDRRPPTHLQDYVLY